MFDLSFGKLAILFTLCLMVLGPEKLPKLAAQLGRFAGQARAMARHFRAQLEQEIAAEDLKKEFRDAKAAVQDVVQAPAVVVDTVTEAATSLATHASGMQAAAEAAVKSHEIAVDSHLDMNFDPSADPQNTLPPHEPMLAHETILPTAPAADSDKTIPPSV